MKIVKNNNAKQNKKHTLSYASVRIVATVLAMAVTLTGCAPIDEVMELLDFDDRQEITVEQEESITPGIIIVEKVEDISSAEDDNLSELPASDFITASEKIGQSDGLRNYAYDKLDDEEKALYTEIYGIISTMAKDTKVSSKDPKQIDKVFNYVMLDHPEIFYITGYSLTKYMRGQNIEKLTVAGTYTMSVEDAAKASLIIDAYVDKCLAGYSGSLDEYEKVKYVYEYLIANTEYDLTVPDNQNILSITRDGRTVCQGYAKAMQYILNKMGVFCILCEGTVKGAEAHVWNIVRIDGKYYQVDATWGDASYQINNNEGGIEAPEVNYDYLCITDDEIKKTHVIKDNIVYPVCDSREDNYYVREGLYLTEVDTGIISAAFEKARANGDATVTLKCENANVYRALFNHMIDNKCIFNYLDGSKNVNFVKFEDECRITFYI